MSFENEDMFGNSNPFDSNSKNDYGMDNEGVSELFTVNIKNVNGEVLSYEVKQSDRIGSLIDTYKKDIGTDRNAKVIFSFQGKILDDNSTFSANNINSDDTIHSLIRLKGGF